MAERVVRVGVAGLDHVHAPGLIRQFQERPEAEVVAIAHDDPQKAQGVADRFHIPRIYASVEEMLDREYLDAVLCCAANAKHPDVVGVAVQKKGLSVFVEKPMAATVDEARRMLSDARRANILLMINYPTTWDMSLHKLKALLDDGAIGQPLYFRWRAGHKGPLASLPPEEQEGSWWYQRRLGGGALLDFCCYGANISLWWFGEMPLFVFGFADRLATPFGDVEDNAVLIARYPNAFAVFEASWSQGGQMLRGPTVIGTEGMLTVLEREGRRVVLLKRREEEFFPPDPPSPEMESGVAHFLSALLHGTTLHMTVSPEFNVLVQAILEAGIKSAQTGIAFNPRMV